MGVSTNGQLSYGIDLGETLPEIFWPKEDEEDEEPESKLCELYGIESSFSNWDQLPVTLVRHCSYDYPMYILAVQESYQYNFRGTPTVAKMEKKPSWDTLLREACVKLELDPSEYDSPAWLLSSMWG